MKKRYDLPQEEDDSEKNLVNEPMAPVYGMEAETDTLPALTQEQLAECMTGEEFLEHWCKCIERLFDK
ncbi:MAG: hypothetical protein LIP08_10595 [Bacteroides sp.]|nr:hypothetical protein [Bacteroides sp.]